MFKDNLKKLRKKNRMTQDDLADRLYVSRALVTKWEAGKRYPSKSMLDNIAELFGIGVEDLIKEDSEALETVRELSECIPEDQGSDEEEDAADDIAVRMIAKKISDFLRSLPTDERNIFLKRYYFYENTDEISTQYGLGADETRTMLAGTRTKLLNYLEREGQ
jgi:transcriptional regulator with XRE-family HTH domain